MFTGIVETTARVRSLARSGPDARLSLEVALASYVLGESISVSGVCLTVTRFDERGFDADVSAETLRCTTLGALAAGARVNIERSLRLGDRLGGHLVLGHVDGVGEVRSFGPVGEARQLSLALPADLRRFVAQKGSLTVDGVSLTVNEVHDDGTAAIMLVPHTLAVTTLGALAAGARVNLEVDVLARYVARQLSCGDADEKLLKSLREGGFL